MIRLAHVSDTHRNQVDLADYPGYVIHTGDFTDSGSPREYDELLRAVEGYADKLIPVPGNHDTARLGIFDSEGAARRFDQFLARIHGVQAHRYFDKAPMIRRLAVDGAQATVIGLNSCAMTASPHDLAEGEIGREQRDALDRALTEARGNGPVILALHHHPFLHSYSMLLADAEELGWIIEGRVDVLLFGHHHHPGRWSGRLGIPHTLAADDSSRTGWAREITIAPGGAINVSPMRVTCGK